MAGDNVPDTQHQGKMPSRNKTCPKCRALAGEKDLFCVSCGANLVTESKPARPKRNFLLGVGMTAIVLLAVFSLIQLTPVRQITTTTTITVETTVIKERTERITITKYEPQWHLVTVFYGTGSTTKTTLSFRIPSDQWRIIWGCKAHPDYPKLSLFSFFVYPEGETKQWIETVYNMGESKEDITYLYQGRGNYYLKIITANTGVWVIVIEAFY